MVGLYDSGIARFFMSSKPDATLSIFQLPIFSKFGHNMWITVASTYWQGFLKFFHLVVISPKYLQARGCFTVSSCTRKPTAQVASCGIVLVTPHCSPRQGATCHLWVFIVCAVSGLWGITFPNFRKFCLFLLQKIPSMYLPVTSLFPNGTLQHASSYSVL